MEDNLLIVNAVAMQTPAVGDYVYRVEQPSIAMGKIAGVSVVNVSTISPCFETLCLQADVLVLHLLTEHDVFPIIDERKRRDLATVYEISDNFTADQSGVGIRNWFKDPVNRSSAFQLISMADGVQVTGDGILERYDFLNPNMMVFENHLAEPGIFHTRASGQIVIGWGGSSGHTEDLKQISRTIADICCEYPHVVFAFMGDSEQYTGIFSHIPESQKAYTPPGALRDYFRFLETLDIGIATMLDTPYNHCRSDIKFVEYASRGVVPVLSNITPYRKHAIHGSNAFLFDSNQELKSILVDLIQNPIMRKHIAQNAYNYTRRYRMEDQHAMDRIVYYRDLCKGRTVKNINTLKLSRLNTSAESYDTEKTEAETLLYRGVREESKGNIRDARALYQKSHKLMPDYYLPLFWLGYSCMRHREEEKAIEFFNHALEINPRSVRTLLYLGNTLKLHDKQKALQLYERALEISPSFAPGIEAIALLCEDNEDYEKAAGFYNLALEVNPFYSNAALGLGRVYSALGNKENALKAFQLAADMSP